MVIRPLEIRFSDAFGFQHEFFGDYNNLLAMLETIGQRERAGLSRLEVSEIVARACVCEDYRKKRVLLIVPDGTRTAPVGLLFQTLHQQFLSLTGQGKIKSRALFDSSFAPCSAAVAVDDSLDGRQTNTRAFVILGSMQTLESPK